MTTTEDSIKAMTDKDLSAFILVAQAEKARREQQRKDETIAKIRALAGAEGLTVSIAGLRGQRPRTKQRPKSGKSARS